MSQKLEIEKFNNFLLRSGKKVNVGVSFQIFGQPLHTAPIILVNHALTGNSQVSSWWSQVVGQDKVIDTSKFTVLACDIPGNGFTGNTSDLIENYKDWTLGDVATLYLQLFSRLQINKIALGIGGSIGGALLWELLVQSPALFGRIVPVAAHWKASQWIQACCHIQEQILNSQPQGLQIARQHAMTFYRTPQSLKAKFEFGEQTGNTVQAWLNYHGKALNERYTLAAYKMLNHLLATTKAADSIEELRQAAERSATQIEIISIDSDLFFVAQDDIETHYALKNDVKIKQHSINSIHGHDAFLIEYDQVTKILTPIIELIPLIKTTQTL